jgi:phosphatidylserine/phosphatidylglycerophosphate/cardiolipin synthase-like enzyme
VSDLHGLARNWVRRLPAPLLSSLIDALLTDLPALESLQQSSHGPTSQAALAEAYIIAKAGHGPYLAGLLDGRRDARREQPVVTPVWTGPEPTMGGGHRLTLGVVAGLIDEAQEEILLVSYATAPSVEVRDALTRAADRGVRITTLLERAEDNHAFSGHADPLAAVPHRALHWAAAARPPGASMHAKILVIDRTSALVGSANFTGYGVERNFECGLLVRGDAIATTLVNHVLSLVDVFK